MLIHEESRQREVSGSKPLIAHFTFHGDSDVSCNSSRHKKVECLKKKAWMEKKGIHSVSVCFESNLIEVSSNTW
nr:uncharacterized protein LOC104242829 [Ipomoea trifida]